jgi:hypothetical protein
MSGAGSAHKPASLVQFDAGFLAGVVSFYSRAKGGGPSSDKLSGLLVLVCFLLVLFLRILLRKPLVAAIETPHVERGLNKGARRVDLTLRAQHFRILSFARESIHLRRWLL